jgi:methyl-accepting chemotaxis protein
MPVLKEHSGFLPLAVAFALLIAMITAVFWMVAQQAQSSGMVRHTLEVEYRLSRLLSSMQDAETGQRGFLLTGRATFLEPYNAALAALDGELDAIGAATSDNPAQRASVAGLRKLYAERADVLRRTIDLYRSGNAKDAVAQPALDRGKALMDQIRAVVAASKRPVSAVL